MVNVLMRMVTLFPTVIVMVALAACVGSESTPNSQPTSASTTIETPTPPGTDLPLLTPVPTSQSTPTSTVHPTPTAKPLPTPRLQPTPTIAAPKILVTSELVAQADFPVAMAFAPDGRLFYTEFFTGRIRVYEGGQTTTFASVDIFVGQECGLLGLAIDPDFTTNGYVYVFYIEPVGSRDDVGHPVVVRFTDVDGTGQEPTPLVTDLPNTNPLVCTHVSGNLNFDPDGYLYFSIGEMEYKDPAQDLGSPLGKMHRINKEDGSAAPDNPFADDPDADPRVYAYGLRNTFDHTFHPTNNKIYAPDNGLGNCDELNIIEAGNNYGHPMSSFEEEDPPCFDRFGTKPIYLFSKPDMRPEAFTSNVAPTGVQFVLGEVYPTLGDALLACEWNTQYMRRITLVGPELDQVVDDSIVIKDCRLDVTTDPSGIIYYSNPGEIRRLVPAAVSGP